MNAGLNKIKLKVKISQLLVMKEILQEYLKISKIKFSVYDLLDFFPKYLKKKGFGLNLNLNFNVKSNTNSIFYKQIIKLSLIIKDWKEGLEILNKKYIVYEKILNFYVKQLKSKSIMGWLQFVLQEKTQLLNHSNSKGTNNLYLANKGKENQSSNLSFFDNSHSLIK